MNEAESAIRILTVKEVADFLRVHPQTVRRWADSGELKYYQFSSKGHRRFMMQDVMEFLDRHSKASEANSVTPTVGIPSLTS